MTSYKDLLAQREKLDREIEELKDKEIAAVVSDIKKKMADYGITVADLGATRGRPRGVRKAVVEPKYRDPATGKTWTGRGKQPHWIAGKKREAFLIGK
jgi:DNA-binding protein H-NS